MAEQLPHDAVALFRVPPGGFVTARDELVARLRSEGRDEEAAVVQELRKPTLALWALNQLADRDPEGVDHLLDAGRELRAAQRAATSGHGIDRFRDATAARRRAIGRLQQVASAAVAEVGSGGSHTETIGPALEAASADDELGRLLAAGTFRGLPTAPTGFGNVFGLEAVPGGGRPAEDETESDQDGGAIEEELERRRGAFEAASAAADQQHEEVARLEAEVASVKARLQELEHQLAAAGASARAAELERKRAERDLAKAAAQLDRARHSDT